MISSRNIKNHYLRGKRTTWRDICPVKTMPTGSILFDTCKNRSGKRDDLYIKLGVVYRISTYKQNTITMITSI